MSADGSCEQRPQVARPAVLPGTALMSLNAAFWPLGVLLLTSVLPLMVPRDQLVPVLNVTAWVGVLLLMLLPGALWALVFHPQGPRVPPVWGGNLMRVTHVHGVAGLVYIASVVLHVGYGQLPWQTVVVGGLLTSVTGLALVGSAWPSAKGAPARGVALAAMALGLVLHAVLVAQFGPEWRVRSLHLGGAVISGPVISHLLLTAGVLGLWPVRGVKAWSQWAVTLGGVALAAAFVVNSSGGAGGSGWSPVLHAVGSLYALLLLHRFLPRKDPEPDPPAYKRTGAVLRWGGFVFLLLSLVLAFTTMGGDWGKYPFYKQAHFHANTLGFLTAWWLAHVYGELEGLMASDDTVYLVLDSQKGFTLAAAVLTLLGAVGLTGKFLVNIALMDQPEAPLPHIISGMGGLCLIAACALWLRMWLMARVVASRRLARAKKETS